MNSIKGSAKDLFRQMKKELKCSSDKNEEDKDISNYYETDSEKSEDYYNDMKYLHKDQLKAYICKLRKELKIYKMKEIDFLIEIKYLKRKIIRLKNIIENDKIINFSTKSLSVKSYNTMKSKERKLYNSERGLGYNTENNSYKSIQLDKESKNIINIINGSIKSSKRKSHKDFKDLNNYRYNNTNNNETFSNKNDILKSNLSYRNLRENKYKNNKNFFNTNIKNKNILNDKDIIIRHKNIDKVERESNISFLNKRNTSYRTYSSTSKFEIKNHLISNNRNLRELSNNINKKIVTDIKKYNSYKENMLDNNVSFTNLINVPINKNNETKESYNLCKNKSINNSSNTKLKKINSKYDYIFNEKHHQNILNKKYISPYSYKQNKINRKKEKEENKENIIKLNIENINKNEFTVLASNNTKNKKLNNKNKNLKNKSKMLNDINEKKENKKENQVIETIEFSPNINKQNTIHNDILQKKYISDSETTKNDISNNFNINDLNKYNYSKDKKHLSNKMKINENKLFNLKKNKDSEIRENMKKELENLKKLNKVLIKSNLKNNFSLDSDSNISSYKDYTKNELKDDLVYDLKNNKTKNILKESKILNISFNDIDKKINNLQNYLKNSKNMNII